MVRDNFYENRSFDAGLGSFTSTFSTAKINSTSMQSSYSSTQDFEFKLGLTVNELGGFFKGGGHFENTANAEASASQQKTATISYTLKDSDKGNFLSVDIVKSFDGNGPVFITLGGATSCPNEKEVKSLYYNKDNYNKDVVGTGGTVLSKGTVAVNKPYMEVDKNQLVNIPESQSAIFNLKLRNLSDTKTSGQYVITVDPTTLHGAQTNVAQNGVNVTIDYDKTVDFPLHITKIPSSDQYRYENIKVTLSDACGEQSVDVFLTVEFKKSCTNVRITTPAPQWVFNRNEAFVDKSTNPLPITFTDFNTEFSGFTRIDLEYRDINSSNWTKFLSYYASDSIKTEAGDENGIVIDPSVVDYVYNWKIVEDAISDGQYEIRAVSYCSDGIKNYSASVPGTISLNAPEPFGTPSPQDGILDIGEDIMAMFNKEIKLGAITDVVVKGVANQQKIDHSVSILLDGSDKHVKILEPSIPDGSFTIQYWLDNKSNPATADGFLFRQDNGISAKISGSSLIFTVQNESVTGSVANTDGYNFYSFVYRESEGTNKPLLMILKNGAEQVRKELITNLTPQNNNQLLFGGTSIQGNLHDIRIWSKAFTPAQAAVAKDLTLSGNEIDLLGYWALDEGRDTVAVDRARYRNAVLNLNWAIKPQSTSLQFNSNAYAELNSVNFVQLIKEQDATLEFWVKTAQADGTIFSNGRGDTEDILQSDSLRNKWSIGLKSGVMTFNSEGNEYAISNERLNDNRWHNVAVTIKRGGSINGYVDGKQVSSVSAQKIGGFSGAKIWIGARGHQPLNQPEVVDAKFVGAIDELRLWNGVRTFEQIKRDAFFELDKDEAGLILYAKMNSSDNAVTPEYFRLVANNLIEYTTMPPVGTVAYSDDAPPIKPKRLADKLLYDLTINKDKVLITPLLTTEEWYLYENQILDISVEYMYDLYNNKQQSTLYWTAYVNRQEIEWFTKDKKKEIHIEKKDQEAYQFVMDVINKGGKNQPYTISGLPVWLKASKTSGTLAPNTSEEIIFYIDKSLAMGSYEANLYLNCINSYTDKLFVDLRVLKEAPNWSVNPADYDFNMNIIGQVKIDGILLRDAYSKVGAFVNDEPRGEAYLKYDLSTDTYLVYLNVYSNVNSGESVTFKIWDAQEGKVIVATLNGESAVSFVQDKIVGSKSVPAVFASSKNMEQIINLNKGWTWITPYVKDAKLNSLNALFNGVVIAGDAVKARYNVYANFDGERWEGSINGLDTAKAYQVKTMKAPSTIILKGELVSPTQPVVLVKGWNLLPYLSYRNANLREALAYYKPSEGDVIKSQYEFAIYDAYSGTWSGTLTYFQAGQGYMIQTALAQAFTYNNVYYSTRGQNAPRYAAQASQPNQEFVEFANNMNVVAQIIGDDDVQQIEVYDGKGELRGYADVKMVDGRSLSYITVYSNAANEILNVKLLKDGSAIGADQTINFMPESVLGTFAKPYPFTVNKLQNEIWENTLEEITVFPNPMDNDLFIRVSNSLAQKLTMHLYDVAGIDMV